MTWYMNVLLALKRKARDLRSQETPSQRHMAPVWVTGIDRKRLDRFSSVGQWGDRRWMNTPGPFYTGRADFALSGPIEAPGFVGIDDEKVDVVFRQPHTTQELELVSAAASCDPFGGYAADGNEHWTLEGVREWWARVPEIHEHITDHLLNPSWIRYPYESSQPLIRDIGVAWSQYLETQAEPYLRQYCYFLDVSSWPDARAVLPDL